MAGVPSLISLCLATIADELSQVAGDDNGDILSVIYNLPSELFESLLPLLPPLALHKLEENLPFDFRCNFEPAHDGPINCQKRKRHGVLDTTWRALYKIRWPGFFQQKRNMAWLDKHDDAECDLVYDWQQKYWEAHLQDCVDAVAETALLPSYDGSIGEIRIPDSILEHIGSKSQMVKLKYDYLKFSFHFHQFGSYARNLRLPNVLCVAETCDLLHRCDLGSLELQWIKSSDHVEGLCKLLNQNSKTLKSIDFIHCKLSPAFINAILNALHMKDIQVNTVEHFSIKRSSFLQTVPYLAPVGFITFINSGRSLNSLILCDAQLGRNFAGVVFTALLNASSSISKLDLSENDISGFLSQFRWGPSSRLLEMDRSLKSLRALNLRSCYLVRDDAECLKHALVHMPNLENLDLSDNCIKDGIRSLITYFTEISGRDLAFAELKLENCELTCDQVIELLGILSSMNKPLKLLSIKGNRLGSKIGASLGKILCTGICSLDVEDIGLGSSGFLAVSEKISKESKVAYINISDNQGGIEAAKFISSLVSQANKIVAIDARYNLMPLHSLPIITSGLKASKGKLEHLDLTGNSLCDQLADTTSVLAEFQTNGNFAGTLIISAAPNVPYDNDP